MSVIVEETQILKDFIAESVEKMDKGGVAYVSGNYCTYNHKDGVLDRHHQKLVSKLHSLGYESTTNHGHGCLDWRFTKKIEL